MKIKTTTLSIIVLVITICSLPAFSQEDEEILHLSLEQARSFAIENNISSKIAEADLRIANYGIKEITATGLPQISSTVAYQYFFDIPTSLVPAEFFGGQAGEFREIKFGTEHSLTAGITLEQLLFDGSYIIGLRAAKIYREISSRSLEQTHLEVKNLITETYLLALVARENLYLTSQNLKNLEQTLYETKKIMEAGFTDPINVDQLELTVSRMKSTISNMERQQQLTVDLLKFQIGMDIEKQVELTDSLHGLFNEMNPEVISSASFNPENHIQYKTTLSQQNFNRMVVLREKSAFLPTLSASLSHQQNAMRNKFNFLDEDEPWFPTSLFSVNLNIPIFSSGYRSSRVNQAQVEWEKSKLATQQVSQSLILQMNQARDSYKTALEKYENERKNLSLAQRILKRTIIMHREGLASSLELTQANEQLVSTQSNYLNAIFELLNAQNDINKAYGRY